MTFEKKKWSCTSMIAVPCKSVFMLAQAVVPCGSESHPRKAVSDFQN